MNKAKIVLSFDDGRLDNYINVYPILLKYKLKATFNIATAYVDGTILPCNTPASSPAMTIPNVVELYKSGCEIAAHGDNHLNHIEDISCGIYKLYNWLGKKDNYIGFASPNSMLSENEIMLRRSQYKNMNVGYIRVGDYKSHSLWRRIARKLAIYSKNEFLFYHSHKEALFDGKSYIYYAIPVMHRNTRNQILYLIKKCIQNKKSCILMFHSILKKGEPNYSDTWSWDIEDFEMICQSLRQMMEENQIDVITNRDIY